MSTRATLSASQAQTCLLAQAKELARRGLRREAVSCFARLLGTEPDHLEALLWLAALTQDPRQSVRYLTRALEISPGNSAALAGLKWAEERQNGSMHASATPSNRAGRTRPPLLDTLLFGGIAMVIVAACAILGLMLWQSPEAIRAAYLPTATATVTLVPSPTLSPTPTLQLPPTSTPAPLPQATSTPAPTATLTRVASDQPSLRTSLGIKRIEIDLSEQRLTAFEGETPVLAAPVSTGVARFPTPLGEYQILRKVRSQVMSGPGYYLPNVEYVCYFYRGYALHGTYWHDNFGQPMSHGCVNMRNEDAAWLYDWAPIGTPVSVHG